MPIKFYEIQDGVWMDYMCIFGRAYMKDVRNVMKYSEEVYSRFSFVFTRPDSMPIENRALQFKETYVDIDRLLELVDHIGITDKTFTLHAEVCTDPNTLGLFILHGINDVSYRKPYLIAGIDMNQTCLDPDEEWKVTKVVEHEVDGGEE